MMNTNLGLTNRIGILILLALCLGCKKYPEGPELSLRTKKNRLENKWKADKWTMNGVQVILGNEDKNYVEFRKNGEYIINVEESGGANKNVQGTWEFYDKKKRLILKTPAYTSVNGNVSALEDTVRIIRLAHDQLWISDEVENPTLMTFYKPL